MSYEVNQQTYDMQQKIAKVLYDGKIGATNEAIINSLEHIDFNGEKIPVTEIMASPDYQLSSLDGKITTSFRNNFNELGFRYRVRLLKLLHMFTRGQRKAKFSTDAYKCLNGCFISTAENLALYYLVPDKDQQDIGGHLNFYMNIRGSIGNVPIPNCISPVRTSTEDPNSKVWISDEERFVTGRFYYKAENPLFLRIERDVLGLTNSHGAIQLSWQDLDRIIDYFTRMYDSV